MSAWDGRCTQQALVCAVIGLSIESDCQPGACSIWQADSKLLWCSSTPVTSAGVSPNWTLLLQAAWCRVTAGLPTAHANADADAAAAPFITTAVVVHGSRYASTYQMLRGTLVLFAGAFTVLILRRQLFIHHWLGMVLITAGAALVGASSVIYASNTAGGSNLAGWHSAAPAAWHAADITGAGAGAGVLNATLSALHYAPGVSRVASRGMLGMVGLPGQGTAASSDDGAALLQPFAAAAAGLKPGVVPGLHVWSAALREGPDVAAAPLFGDLLVVGAQMFTALQFILEEKFLVKYKVGNRSSVLIAFPCSTL